MSTKKRTLAGGTHCDIKVQDFPSSSKNFNILGEHNYKRIKHLHDKHSPVKMRLNFSDKFKYYQLNSDESINRCNKVEVKFPLNPIMEVATGLNSAIESKQIDILAAKQLTVDNVYYSHNRGSGFRSIKHLQL